MDNKKKSQKIIVICGPTGVGKTGLSLKLAQHFNGEIISADSRQIYKYMNIGTAKPTQDELKKIPHHLIDIISPDEKFTAGLFIKSADAKIKEINNKKKVPFIVGGTGFYISSLLQGLCKIPEIPKKIRSDLKKEIVESGLYTLYKELQKIDKIAANKIESNDGNRIIRALEVYRYTGKPISYYWQRDSYKKRYNAYTILLTEERGKLYQRINSRVNEMLESGLYDEFKALLLMGYSKNSPGLNSLGYKEFFDFQDGLHTWIETIDLIKQHMRNYAKRQLTWFRKQEINLTISTSNLSLFDIKKRILEFLGHDEPCCNSK
ncbi:MAG TPA: tRNA (adenosine(37)-N6)-dimethylallyltransferase MiaA [Candidatus Cloacimonetes bacterium]|nr:tRNA (adenosine(37)-N6)-dimethylallyltransferase MiaA [Candidatus Cloacimonadota bacterium]HEX37441.1 tRNA (adenosine(37)-N6)-dimethylallyltransferase MiaA [Candidatus Cloacimonadota bacterium]